VKKCLFCCANLVSASNNPQRGTREHIFPKWLLEEEDAKKHPISFSHLEMVRKDGHSLQLTPPEPHRRLALNSFLLGNVCGSCNNGWMSTLENDVKNDLIALVRVSGTTIRDRKKLAIWCVKTAFTLSEYLQPNVGALPKEIGEELHTVRSQLPTDTAVFYTPSTTKQFWFSIPSTHEIRAGDQTSAQKLWGRSSKIVFQVGKAIFQVVHAPNAREMSYNLKDCVLLGASLKIRPQFGSSVRDTGVNDDLFVFTMSNSLLA
jgi:hypothetical protein